MVEADWGGTPAESWTSLDTLGSDAALMPVFAARAAEMDKQADVEAIKARYAREDAAAKAAGRTAGSSIHGSRRWNRGQRARYTTE